ncbi:hypothetical protein [Nocardia africana]|uniref:Uncharacterized protein n=1 Tax=Nocardia africana TaxID=134964 RepID=A0A378X170_9NOCA|nr:hypothetical protein [Nocardia africana]MCC3318296.1 hypothetical protein [Nocardia africana]SUA47356.1 Uncharacterised protein [Nocardia africana]
MTDDQLGFDIDFDERSQQWLDWIAPQQIEAAIRALLTDTVPGVADYSEVWWQPPISTRVLEAVRQHFGSWEAFVAPENFTAADQFIRYLGEVVIRRRPGMTWTTADTRYRPLYKDFAPAVHFADGPDEDLVSMAESLFITESAETTEYEIDQAGKPC